jgi:hypothetical protein
MVIGKRAIGTFEFVICITVVAVVSATVASMLTIRVMDQECTARMVDMNGEPAVQSK